MAISNASTQFFEKVYPIIKFIVLGLLIFLLIYAAILVLWVFLESLSSGLVFRINTDTMSNNLIFWDKYSLLFKSLFGVMGLYIAIVNLDKYIKGMLASNSIEAIRSLQVLRERLESNDGMIKIHETLELDPKSFRLIYPTGVNSYSNLSDLFNYLGILELGSVMVQKEIIPIKDFSNQFGYRIQNILESESMIDYLVKDAKYYHDLIWIIRKLIEEKLIQSSLYYCKLQSL